MTAIHVQSTDVMEGHVTGAARDTLRSGVASRRDEKFDALERESRDAEYGSVRIKSMTYKEACDLFDRLHPDEQEQISNRYEDLGKTPEAFMLAIEQHFDWLR